MISDINHFHLFSGAGVGAAGMQEAQPEIPGLRGRMVCLGGIDVDAAGAADFHQFTGVRCTVRDLFSRQQYTAFHGRDPADGWAEAMPADIQAAAGGRRPNIMFLSAPCKGFSGLLSHSRSLTAKYQALNELTLRGVWLALEAWKDDPVEVILFENVPRIASRGRHFLDQIVQLLRHYGYVVRETAHDCGELGGLAQSRKRFLLVARHAEKVPAFIYEPPKRPLRAVGEILGRMHLPGDLRAGPMHRIPNLSWKTWVRLAFVEAGSDWRSLNRLAVQDGYLRDYLLVPEMRRGALGVHSMQNNAGVIAARNYPLNGAFSVADPRFDPSAAWKDGQAYGVRRWEASTGAIAGQQGPGQGAYSVADPRHHGPAKHSNEFRIIRYDAAARAVTGAHGTGQCVADPRTGWPDSAHGNKLAVTTYEDPAKTITGARFGSGGLCVADPRPGLARERGDHYLTAGHYGVATWDQHVGAVSASACHDNGAWSVADPRALPAANDKLVCRIVAEDGTWHRPFTTLEQARRTVFRSFSGFGSAAVTGQSSGFRANSNRSGTTPAHDWMNYPDCLRQLVQRLRGVVIENRDAIDCMTRHDGPDTLHYVDPPYVHSTRSFRARAHSYRHEMTDQQHEELAGALRQLKGMVVLSGYRCDLYDRLYAGWTRVDGRAHADGARPRVESLWLSPSVPSASLFPSEGT